MTMALPLFLLCTWDRLYFHSVVLMYVWVLFFFEPCISSQTMFSRYYYVTVANQRFIKVDQLPLCWSARKNKVLGHCWMFGQPRDDPASSQLSSYFLWLRYISQQGWTRQTSQMQISSLLFQAEHCTLLPLEGKSYEITITIASPAGWTSNLRITGRELILQNSTVILIL